LKVFTSLSNWLNEFRLYQRDTEGRIVKQNDHLMDATRYLIMSGRDRMRTPPAAAKNEYQYVYPNSQSTQWME
jgi:hypothetical protein